MTYRAVVDVMFEAASQEEARTKLAEIIGRWAVSPPGPGALVDVVGLNEVALMEAETDYFPPGWVAGRTRRREAP